MSGGLVYGSVCSGIEAASVAWHPLGWRAAFVSDIDPFARAVLTHRFPDVPLRGDFTEIQAGDHEPVDLLVGGTPCQSFSVAGLRGGLDDDRGNLALEFLRLAQRLRPEWLVWENVPGVLSSNGGRDFGAILGGMVELGYGFAYRVLDAQFVRVDGLERAVPQRRRRVFVVGRLGDWRAAAAVLFESEGMRGDSPPRREAGQGVARPVASSSERGSGYRNDADTADNLIAGTLGVRSAAHPAGVKSESEFLVPLAIRTSHTGANGIGIAPGVSHAVERAHQAIAYGGNRTSGPIDVAPACNAHPGGSRRLDFESEALLAEAQGYAVRRLTPLEAERLQGLPDHWTLVPYRGKPASDGPRYRAIGNSFAVNVVRWIGGRIDRARALTARAA